MSTCNTNSPRCTLSLVALIVLNVVLVSVGAFLLFALMDSEPGASAAQSHSSGAMLAVVGVLLLAVNYWLGWRKSCKRPPQC